MTHQKYIVQSVLIPKLDFTLNEAAGYILDHGYKSDNAKLDITKSFYRFRQHSPKKDTKTRTKKLSNGVELVIQYPDE